jgi:hypothetical protein
MLDFDPWEQMLQKYVDAQGRVDYQTWKTEAQKELEDWLQALSQIHTHTGDNSNQQLALWLNLYNALTIAQVLSHYPLASIQPKLLGLPNWLAFFWFFQRPLYYLEGVRYSLNDIEHGILRRQWREPRLHFALVCASLGCPLLRPHAYRGQTVQQQLEDDAHRFINNPSKVYYQAQSHILYCSTIFRWYRQDFLQVAPSIPAYLQTYLTPAIQLTPPPRLRYLPYDWSLNQRISA